MADDVVTVERVIAAPPAAIFALIADPSRHREIDGSGTVRDAKEESQVLTLGSKFGMNMHAGLSYSMVNEVVEYDPDRVIAWQTRPSLGVMGLLVGGRIWRYELEPVKGGTRVRESWDITHEKAKFAIRTLRGRTREGMEKTLARIEEIVTR